MNDANSGAAPANAEACTTPAPGHSLKRNAVHALLGNGVLSLCRFAVVALLAKFASTEIQGTFTYASIALAAPVVLFCGLELRAAFVADAGGEFSFGVYRTLRAVGMCVAGAVLLATVLWITRSETNRALVWLMLAICAGRIVLHLAEVYWGVYQRRERLDLMGWSNTIRGLAMLAPFAVLLPILAGPADAGGPGPERRTQLTACAVSVYVLAWVATWWFFDERRVVGHPDVDLSWSWPDLWKLARQTLPLGLVFLLINLRETVTQWLIKRVAGSEGWTELGYFGAMRVLTLGAMFLIVQVSTAAGNRLANYYQKDPAAFVRLAAKLTGLAVAVGAGVLGLSWLFGKWLLRFAYTPEYAQHYPEFLVLVLAQAITLLAAVFGFVTTHMRQFWIQVPAQLAVLAATVIAGALLIHPDAPVRGGAWTMVVCAVAQVVLYFGCVLTGVRWRDHLTRTRQ